MKTLNSIVAKQPYSGLFVFLLGLLLNNPVLSLAQSRDFFVEKVVTADLNNKGFDGNLTTAGVGYGTAINNHNDRGNWYYYDDGTNVDAIGLTNGGSIFWGIMLPAGQYDGNYVTKVSVYDFVAHTGNILIYQGGTAAPGTLLATEPYSCTGSHGFVEFNLSSPISIDSGQNLWIVFNNNDGQYVASVCANTGDANGRWVSTDGTSWQDIASLGSNLDFTFMIRVYIDSFDCYNFEDGTLQGWTNIDADGDGNVWVSSANPGIYHNSGVSLTGTGHNASQAYVISGSYANQTGQPLTPDNYLVSPTKATYSSISFWACAQDANYAADHFGVAVSTGSNANANNFTTVQEWTMTAKGSGTLVPGRGGSKAVTQGSWYYYSVDLSAYAGQNIWVAIRHFNCTNMFILNVDDIILEEGSPVSSYEITASANPTNGGTVSGAGTYSAGASCTLTATPSTGYTFTKWTKNGTQVSTNPSYTFTVNASASYVAVFTPNSYTISATANPTNGGTVSGAGTYSAGASCTLTATPATGYTFTKWTKNGTQVSTNPSYTFTVTASASYVAVFSLTSYSITVSSDPVNGGIVNGGGNYSYGQLCTLSATPNGGYVFDKWTKNGLTVSTNPLFAITVSENANYVARFLQSINNSTITAIVDPIEGGTVSGAGTFEQGSSCVLTATPNEGYVFDKWTKNGATISTNPVVTITVSENANFVAHFSVLSNDYTITVVANPLVGGEVSGGGVYSPGATCTLTVAANEGYSFANWTENGMIVSLDEQYSFVVEENRYIYANFNTASCYYISASAGANGEITPRGDIEVPSGGDQTFTITPNFGCRIGMVLIDGVDFGPLETYTFNNVNANHTISVVFSGWGVEESSALNVKVYPNPTKDMVTIEGSEILNIQVFDMLGHEMCNVKSNNTPETISLQDLVQGTYVIVVTMRDGRKCYQNIMLSRDL